MGDIIHLDYETYSDLDLKKVGAFRYISDASAQILMAAVALNNEEPVIWVHPEHESKLVRSDPRALEIMQMWEDNPDILVYAHNAQFEMACSRYRIEKDIGITPPRIEQWRCTQVIARKAAIPPSLEKCAAYLNLAHQKDKGGLALIKLFCNPQKITKKNPHVRITGKMEPEKFKAFTEYCLQDVRTEQGIHRKLKPFELTGTQLEAFLFDMRLNMRGVPVNRTALLHAQKIIDDVMNDLGERYKEITGCTIKQYVAVAKWFKARGYKWKGMAAENVEAALADLSWAKDKLTREAIQLHSELSFAAVFKVTKMLVCDCGDGWVRGCFKFYGAGTGRWSAELIQPQNFKKPSEKLKKHTESAIEAIHNGATREEIEICYGNPLDVLSSAIRHFISLRDRWCKKAKTMLLQADYSSIEARIVQWLAGQEDALDQIRRYDRREKGAVEPYVYMAMRIWPHLGIEDISKDSFERFVGKQAVLGCGFQMSWQKFQATCLKYGQEIDDETAQLAVSTFRKTYDKVAKLWNLFERAARNAILHPGKMFHAGPKVKFTVVAAAGLSFLVMKLPSGRNLVYPEPMIEAGGKFGDQITFFGQIPKKSIWGRISTYGAMLVENATQATAFDIMANGAVLADRAGFELVALIHDEALALGSSGKTLEQFVKVLTTLPGWAEGLPIVAEGGVIPHYKK